MHRALGLLWCDPSFRGPAGGAQRVFVRGHTPLSNILPLEPHMPVARNFPQSSLPVSVLVFVWSAFAFRLELAARLCLCNIMIARSSKHQARTQPSQVTCCCVSPADGGIITASSKKTFEDTISVCDRDKQKLRHSHPPVSP